MDDTFRNRLTGLSFCHAMLAPVVAVRMQTRSIYAGSTGVLSGVMLRGTGCGRFRKMLLAAAVRELTREDL